MSLLEDSKQQAKNMLSMVNNGIVSMNTVTVEEFSKYAVLFDQSIRQAPMDQQYAAAELMKEYSTRFSLFHPINIVDQAGNTVQILPPMFAQPPLLNTVIPKSGDLLRDFGAITLNPAQPEEKKLHMNAVLSAATIHATRIDEGFSKKKAITRKLTEDFDNKAEAGGSAIPQTAIKDKTKDMDWT